MKAVLAKSFGPLDQLVLEEVPARHAGPGEVVIAVKACGVNFFDALIVQGKYQTRPPLPFSPGGEVAGIVSEVGEGVGTLRKGMRVLAFTGHGGYAGEVTVDAASVIPLPEEMDFVTGASFPITYGTSYHALKDRAQLRGGETLLVLGAAGGVGLAAVEIGRIMGARVIAAASSDEKLALARQHGADALINYGSADLRERIRAETGGRGVDVVYDPVGGGYAEPALRSLAAGGRYLVIGFASGEIPKIALNLLLLKMVSMVGVFWGAFAKAEPQRNAANLAELLGWYVQGKLRPHVSATFPLERYREALDAVIERRALGKVVIEMS
ncbi:MAG: NADPH:quinone oxidoreductase family protein [Gammaproteobacteria bacterium]|nr:NADPH:quinone oxidoreductase family protein [Gammaproteobacteria bacterium]MBV8403884.1 NADPH:quinone oxidoreductase family protein [Gammaproteobacteria bacterium]